MLAVLGGLRLSRFFVRNLWVDFRKNDIKTWIYNVPNTLCKALKYKITFPLFPVRTTIVNKVLYVRHFFCTYFLNIRFLLWLSMFIRWQYRKTDHTCPKCWLACIFSNAETVWINKEYWIFLICCHRKRYLIRYFFHLIKEIVQKKSYQKWWMRADCFHL